MKSRAIRAKTRATRVPVSLVYIRSPTDRTFSIFAQHIIEGFGHQGLKAEAMLASADMHGS